MLSKRADMIFENWAKR